MVIIMMIIILEFKMQNKKTITNINQKIKHYEKSNSTEQKKVKKLKF